MAETFLEALTPDEAADLRASGRERHYDTNLALFHEGDDAGSVIVLLAGRAKITLLSSSGREVIVAVRGPGDLLGELAALIDAPRSATVVTIEQVDALIVSGSAFAAFL
jgi:CRP/FNR family transcriptional regulator, cyclic AMP receptor protein